MTAIEDKFDLLVQSGVDLGQAISLEVELFDGGTRQDFEGGAIYFHPSVGAFYCRDLILDRFRELGDVQSGLGYPVSDEEDDPFVLLGRKNDFEFGTITFSDEFGVNVQFNELITTPQVVVKIVDSIAVALEPGQVLSLDDLVSSTDRRGGEFVIEAIKSIFPDLVFRRTFESLTSQEILDLVAQAQDRDPEYSPPNFDNFLEIDCPVGFDTDSLANTLKTWQGVVEYAYTAPTASDPAVVGTSNERFGQQVYLAPAPKGISVQAAWVAGADGTQLNLVDIEQGWLLDHEDLPDNIRLLDGRIRESSIGHGTAVLGEIVAIDDVKGIVGIAPRTGVFLLSRFVPNPIDRRQIRDRVAEMIMKAIKLLFAGDVILLEVQYNDLVNPDVLVPVETDRRALTVIELATRLGLIVVEAAGNASFDLDTFVNDEGKNVLQRGSSDFKNSGAIMVGACQSAMPNPSAGHARWILVDDPTVGSNFGSRVDVYAWGENITTTGTKSIPVKKDSYMNDMSGTSGAAAIIAGVCLLVQNLQTLKTPVSGITGLLSCAQLQRMLSNPANGTGSPDRIGVMPDLARIIANEYR